MSHTTTLKGVHLKDVRAIKKAVETLQSRGVAIELRENTTARMWYEAQTTELGVCDYVLALPKTRFDVGLKRDSKTGVYMPVFDAHANIVHSQIGSQCALPQTPEEQGLWHLGMFAQEYQKEAAINAATDAGYYVESAELNAKGEVELVFTGM